MPHRAARAGGWCGSGLGSADCDEMDDVGAKRALDHGAITKGGGGGRLGNQRRRALGVRSEAEEQRLEQRRKQVEKGKLTPEYVKAVEVQIARARELYASARSAVPDLPENARLVVCAIIELLEAIVDELEARGGDSLTRKLKPTKVAVLQALFRALRTSSR